MAESYLAEALLSSAAIKPYDENQVLLSVVVVVGGGGDRDCTR